MRDSLLVFVCCAILWCGHVRCLYPMLCEHSSEGVSLREQKPWLARVIPHPEAAFHTLCIASCIHPRVFYTAARCLIGLTIGWVGVDYLDHYVKIKAMVTTREAPHDQSDGFAVTESTSDGQWATVAYHKRQPLELSDFINKQGLTMMKIMTLVIISNEGDMKTAELDVVVNRGMVNKRFDVRGRYKNTYTQWGFHPCTEKEVEQELPKCKEYIKVTGAPLVFYNQSLSKDIVIGVSTWSDCSSRKANYPVVFSYIFGDEAKDLECAKLIAEDEEMHPPKGYYDKLCSSNIIKPLKGWVYERE